MTWRTNISDGQTKIVVAFDKSEYDRLRTAALTVAEATRSALSGATKGSSIGADLRAQPAEATWGPAVQVGNSSNKLATQVRTYTDVLCGKTLPEFAASVRKSAESFEEVENDATDNSRT